MAETDKDDVLKYKATRKERRLRRAEARAKRIQPGVEERSQFYEGGRQGEDSVTSEPSVSEFDSVVRMKEALRAARRGEVFEVAGDVELGELAENARRRARLRPPSAREDFGFVTDSDIDGHNAAVTTLTAEVNAGASAERQGAGTARPLTLFQTGRWTPYVMKWNAWVTDHTGTMSRFDDSGFAALRLEYGQLRQEWLQLGQRTEAPPTTPGTPPGGSVPIEIGKSIGETIEKVFVAAVVVGGIYLVLSRLPARRAVAV